jgi:hypothetical protein
MRCLIPLCLVASWVLAQPPAAKGSAPQDDPTALPEVRNYILTMGKVEKWAAASRSIVSYQIGLGGKIAGMPDPPPNLPHTLEAYASWTKANYPTHVKLVERAGLTFKEYLVIDFAIKVALGAASMAERGVQPPPGMFINQANVKFVNANKARITAMYAEFQQLALGHK